MVLSLVLLGLAVAVALGVLAFAAYPQRGRPVPGAYHLSSGLGSWVARVTPPPAHPSYGVLMPPEGDERARQWFDSADARLLRGAARLGARPPGPGPGARTGPVEERRTTRRSAPATAQREETAPVRLIGLRAE